jgi:CheY-like chemotaxis protein
MEACVVIVDDERDVLELLREVLEDSGFEVVPVQRPDNVEAVNQQRHPDLVLMDLMLPGISGIELARKLRGDGMCDTPIVAMSASRRMLSAAADSHLFQGMLPKPFELTELLACVGKHVGR